jgi:acetylornithine/N-succinyldiaminopimelate aminotransferase
MTGRLDVLRAGRDLHLDHYQGGRLPFAVTGGHGIRSQLTVLDGADAGRTFEVLDASGTYASACLGAGHPVVRRAVDRGVTESGHSTDELGSWERARLLTDLFGPDGRWTHQFPHGQYHVCGRNSGSEGMELALRLMLETRFDRHTLRPTEHAGHRNVILAFQGAWHGWTTGLVPLMNRRHYRAGLPVPETSGPYGITVDHLPFGDAGILADYFAKNGARLLGVVVEPVQGDAGILLPPAGFLRRLSELCTEHGALLVADEVLTFAKAGRFFAMVDERGPVPTDITVIGKSIGMGALSLSMVIARRGLSVRGSGAVATSDLRPLACAVMHDGLSHIADERLLQHSAEIGRRLRTMLRQELVDAYPDLYREARGVGVMHGVELTEAAAAHLPRLREHLIRSGVYVEFMAGAGRRTHGLRYVFPTLRVAPPLITTADEAGELVSRLADGSRTYRKQLE